MTARALPTAFALALAATLAVPMASAGEGQVAADAAVYGGGAKHTGNAAVFYLTDHIEDPDDLGSSTPPPQDDPVLGITIDAQGLEALLVETRYLVTAADAARQADPRHDTAAPPQRAVLDDAQAVLVSQQDDFQVHVLPRGAEGAVPFAASTLAGRYDPYAALSVGAGRFQPATSGDPDERLPESGQFWQVRVDQPVVVLEDEAAQMDITFQGDMVLEVVGAAVEASDADESLMLESGVWNDPALGTGLPLDQPAVYGQRNVLLRFFLSEATVRITVQGGSPGLYVASPDLTSEHAGEATLLNVVGSFSNGEQTQKLDGPRHVLAAGHTIVATPEPDRLALAIASTPAATAGGARPALGASDPGTVAAVLAVLALLAAAGIGLARRLTAAPDLRQVEAAIEGQRYGRAARLAKRILRARPGFEDAMLGRAIALAKDGRAGAAISEIHAHIARREPSDGSLHYVLGLAFLDVGREPEARIALAEAVRRTPSLQADVMARLGQQGSSGPLPTSVREVHGYA